MSSCSIGLCLAATFLFSDATPGSEDMKPLDELVKAVQAAENSSRRRGRVRLLLDGTSQQQIEGLMTHRDNAIALQAAWELVRRSVPENFDSMKRGEPAWKIDRGRLQRFLGFAEGRLRVRVPTWWGEQLAKVSARSRDVVAVGFGGASQPYHTTEAEVHAPKDLSIRWTKGAIDLSTMWTNGTLVLSQGKDIYRIPEKVIDIETLGGENSIWGLSALFTADHVFLAFHSPGGAYRLWCLNRKNGAELWSACVWTGYSHIGGTGIGLPEHSVTLVLRDNQLFVFGANAFTMYVEAFSTENGKALFRFSTSY